MSEPSMSDSEYVIRWERDRLREVLLRLHNMIEFEQGMDAWREDREFVKRTAELLGIKLDYDRLQEPS